MLVLIKITPRKTIFIWSFLMSIGYPCCPSHPSARSKSRSMMIFIYFIFHRHIWLLILLAFVLVRLCVVRMLECCRWKSMKVPNLEGKLQNKRKILTKNIFKSLPHFRFKNHFNNKYRFLQDCQKYLRIIYHVQLLDGVCNIGHTLMMTCDPVIYVLYPGLHLRILELLSNVTGLSFV